VVVDRDDGAVADGVLRFSDAQTMVEAIIYRYRYGLAWRDLPKVFGPWQTVWTWHRRVAADGSWDEALTAVTAQADAAGALNWSVAVDSTIARGHRHTTNIARHTGGWVDVQESATRAA
jgi:putative transposase